MRHPPVEFPARYPPEEYGYGRRQVIYDAPEYAPMPPRERMRPYREMPPQPQRHPPEHFPKYEEEHPAVVAKVCTQYFLYIK